MAIDRNLVQGSMAMMILRLLETKDMYGYEMIGALRENLNSLPKKGHILFLLLREGGRWGFYGVQYFRQDEKILPADSCRKKSMRKKRRRNGRNTRLQFPEC